MCYPTPARLLAIFFAFGTMGASAQMMPAPSSDPTVVDQARATAPELAYRSALDGYLPFTDDRPVPWGEANRTVYTRGGFRAYAAEAAGEESAAPAAHPPGMNMPQPTPRKEAP